MSTERSKGKKRAKEDYDYEELLKRSFDRWDYLNEHGGSDPHWEDGCNMELIRGHIMYYKEKIEESGQPYPEIYHRDTPPEVDRYYMARPDEIRENAKKSLAKFDANENLSFVRQEAARLSDKEAEKLHIPFILGYERNLRTAIAEDNLLEMRRYENPCRYIESFEQAANALRQHKPTEDVQLSLF